MKRGDLFQSYNWTPIFFRERNALHACCVFVYSPLYTGRDDHTVCMYDYNENSFPDPIIESPTK